jgi:ribosomal-protein-alanine N-acetyltransferase
LTIREMRKQDVPEVMAIQSACPEIAQWIARDYARAAEGDMAGWCAEEGGAVRGFLVARQVANEIEVLNFAVQPGKRRRGFGRALLEEALAWGRTFSADKAFLEVRVSNLAAIRFYESHGFKVAGQRPRYYSAPIEDALVLAAVLGASPPAG